MKCPRRSSKMSHRKDGTKNGTACCLNFFFFFFFKISHASVISFIPSKGSQRSLFGKMLITFASGSSPRPLPALVWLLRGPRPRTGASVSRRGRKGLLTSGEQSPNFRAAVSMLVEAPAFGVATSRETRRRMPASGPPPCLWHLSSC